MGTFVLLLLLSVPIGSAIGLAVVTTIIAFPNMTTFGFLGSAMITSLNSFPLLAVPFFMLCGSIMGAGGLSQRLVRIGEALVGRFTGGLAMVIATEPKSLPLSMIRGTMSFHASSL